MTESDSGVVAENLTTALIFGTPLVSTRTVADGPCAPEDLAVLSDGALFVEDDVAAQLVQYETAVTLTHRCSTLGCPGAVDNTEEIPVCRTELPSVDANGFFMWHTFLEIPEAAVFSMPHTTSPGFIKMEYRVKLLPPEAEDALSADEAARRQAATAPERRRRNEMPATRRDRAAVRPVPGRHRVAAVAAGAHRHVCPDRGAKRPLRASTPLAATT